MVQEVTKLDNDSYLIIVYGKDRNKVQMTPYDTKVKKSAENLLNTALKGTIAKTALACYSSPIAQNLASKALPSAVLGRVNSSIYDIMADGKVTRAEVAEDFVGSCTNALDNVATNMGFPTPSSLYSAIMPTGTGVISKDFANLLSKKMDKDNLTANKVTNQQDLKVLKLKIVTSDKETWSADIPTRKTESGFEIATAIGNNNKTKDFDVRLVTDEKAETDMYQLKNQLEEIRDLKEPFDVYVNDKDVLSQYKFTNCLFSSLDFTPEGKNTLQCSLSITEIPEWDIQLVKLDTNSSKSTKSSSSSKKSGSSNKSGVKKVTSSVAGAVKTATKVQKCRAYPASKSAQAYLSSEFKAGKSNAQIASDCKKHDLPYNEADIASFRLKQK